MGLQDVAFLPSRAGFPTTFLIIVVKVMTSGLPQLCKRWLWVSKGMLPVKHVASKILDFMAVDYCGRQQA